MSEDRGPIGIISCGAGRHFADKVFRELELIVSKEEKDRNQNRLHFIQTEETWFANGEPKTIIHESIRNMDVYIIQDVENNSGGRSINDNFVALKTALDAASWTSDAHYVSVIEPVMPYARQDKPKGREGRTARMAIQELERLGATRVITLDVHNEAVVNAFDRCKFENLHASKQIAEYVSENIPVNRLVIAAPDTGAVPRNEYYANKLQTELNMLYKKRNYAVANKVEKMVLLGDVKDKDVLLVDDIIDTAGTLKKNVLVLKRAGARRIYFACSLPLFHGKALYRIDQLFRHHLIDGVIGTNVVFKPERFQQEHPWYREVREEKYFARVIYNINKGISLSRLLE